MHSKFITIFTVMIIFFCASANSEFNSRTLKACTQVWEPFVTSEGGVIGGIDTKTLKEVSDALGFASIEIQELPWKRCIKLAEEGKVDIVFTVSKNYQREQFLYYPKTALHSLNYVFITKKGNAGNWSLKQDVSSLPQPIGIPLGYSVADSLRNVSNLQIDDSATDDRANFKKLMLNRVGSIIVESTNGKALINSLNINDVEILSPPYSSGKNYYFAVSKKAKDSMKLVNEIDKVLPGFIHNYK